MKSAALKDWKNTPIYKYEMMREAELDAIV